MKSEINFGYDKHSFEPIYETIKTYFPIDNPEINNDNITDFDGWKEIGDIINTNFINQKNYREKWVKFKNFLKVELKKPIEVTMSAFYPCYSGAVVFEKTKNSSSIIKKELHFYISLLGPYYSIVGVDKSEISLEEIIPAFMDKQEERVKRPYPAIHAITVSPYSEFEEPFNVLKKKISEYFPSYQYIPFEIGMIKIPGITFVHQDSKGELKDSVFSALFRPDLDFNSQIRGDSYYGFDAWLKIKPIDPEKFKLIKEELLKKSLINFDELTLNKVWKFKSAKPLPRNPEIGNLMFGMDPMEIIDLTCKTSAIIVSKENEEPIPQFYEVINNEIHFNNSGSQIIFKISKLTNNELVLVLIIKITNEEGREIKSPIVEMLFERYKL